MVHLTVPFESNQTTGFESTPPLTLGPALRFRGETTNFRISLKPNSVLPQLKQAIYINLRFYRWQPG